MSLYTIVVTPQHDAVDYAKYVEIANGLHFAVQIERTEPDAKRKTMVFIPYSFTTALNLHDLTKWLDSNAPLLTTYVICG